MSLFPSIFCTIAVFSLYGEYVVRSFLPDGVFLPCDHGLAFWHQLMCKFNQSIKLTMLSKIPSGRGKCTTYSPYKDKAASEKATSPNKQKGKKKETRVAIEGSAYQRTIERRAAASMKA